MRFTSRKADVAEMNMTPMIDIVFQLIAFFMVITNFEQIQADERVKLPKDELAKPPQVKRENQLVVNVGFVRDQEGRKLDPTAYVFYASDQIPVLEFGPILQREYRLAEELKQDPKAMTIVIRADRETPTGLVQEIMRMAQEAGFEKFSFKATQTQLSGGY